ncbi:type II toxin-antitoxin system Phd/YefM family antitoxin [Bosea lathyri]|jgi:prevent-host-death family protein|uniref:Antitoxin n=1 Tax=Bosea lathyri TaxID=1036778 RepID=A0A1H6BLF3_9HYPH|nr:type II toxin-antitoxin system prevent-host-death family antitoxin [Bosea lathyri]SEG61504.1 prevent-host-death family protein [Bosea lathyri]
MDSVSLADAKAHLSELVDRAIAGEEICITRRGTPVARLTPIRPAKRRIDIAELRAVTEGSTPQTESAGEFMRRMRDDARY